MDSDATHEPKIRDPIVHVKDWTYARVVVDFGDVDGKASQSCSTCVSVRRTADNHI